MPKSALEPITVSLSVYWDDRIAAGGRILPAQNAKVNLMDTSAPFPIVIAAAGTSSRYGRPKLLELLPGQPVTLIEHVVRECLLGGAGPVVVVLGPVSIAPYDLIGTKAGMPGAQVLHVDPAPGEMRQSIEHGIGYLESLLVDTSERRPDYFGFMPADLPAIASGFVQELIAHTRERRETLVRGMTPQGRGLHPVAMRWKDRTAISELPEDRGLNALWQNPLLTRTDFFYAVESMCHDLDNPQDWQKFPFPRDRSSE